MITAIVLAAGKGTRMKSHRPKVLHQVAGKSMVERVVQSARAGGCDRVVVVVGHGGDQVASVLPPEATIAWQHEQLGTAHAVLAARAECPTEGTVVILNGDVPLIQPATIRALIDRHRTAGARLTLLSCIDPNPGELGRVVRDSSGRVIAIVEARDATAEQLQIRETNRGVYCADAAWLWPTLESLPASPSGEYYLTDAVAAAVQQRAVVEVVISEDPAETSGINDRVQLAEAEAIIRRRINERLMRSGVTLRDPATTYIDEDVEIGIDSVIEPNTQILGASRIGQACRIGPNTVIRDTTIGDECLIVSSVIEDSVLESRVDVGPFSHLRSGAYLERGVHIGNYAEVKNSRLGAGSKMGHFSYVGDASVGADVNIGAGTITCNYDGTHKNRTTIGDGAFIGSDTMLVAPVTIGAGAITGAGAVVTKDVPPRSLAVGVPARIRPGTQNEAGET